MRNFLVAITVLFSAGACDDSTDPTELSTVRGRVISDQPVTFDADSELIVRLSDVSLQDVASPVISEVVLSGPRELPVPFVLPYNPEEIDERNTYSVGARIEQGNTLLYISTTANLVITHGNPDRTDVEVEQVN